MRRVYTITLYSQSPNIEPGILVRRCGLILKYLMNTQPSNFARTSRGLASPSWLVKLAESPCSLSIVTSNSYDARDQTGSAHAWLRWSTQLITTIYLRAAPEIVGGH